MTPHNIKQLKRLNQVIFPVSYNDKFYKDVLEVGELAKLGIICFFPLFICLLVFLTLVFNIRAELTNLISLCYKSGNGGDSGSEKNLKETKTIFEF